MRMIKGMRWTLQPLMPLLQLMIGCIFPAIGGEIEFLPVPHSLIVDIKFKEDDSPLSFPIQISPNFDPKFIILEPDDAQEDLVKVDETGYMGDARVALLTVQPRYKHIRVKIETGISRSGSNPLASYGRPFDDFLASLLPNFTPISSPQPRPAPTGKGWIPPSPACKVYVREDGIYHINLSDLKSAGVPIEDIDPRTFRMFNMGRVVPLFVAGESDGHFDPDDYIEFWGESYRDDYTDLNVYWLTWGSKRGERMALKDGGGKTGKIVDRCVVTEHFERNARRIGLGYISGLKSSLFWTDINLGEAKRVRLDLYGVIPNGMAKLRVLFYGRSLTHHHLKLYLNGVPIGDLRWSGQTKMDFETAFPAGILRNGVNFLTMRCLLDAQSADVDQSVLDWIDVEYTRRLTAHDDLLSFKSPDLKEEVTFRLSGFSGKGVEVYRDGWVKFTNLKPRRDGSGYTLEFTDVPGGSQYIALSSDRKLKPVRIEMDTASSLRNASNSADYLIITSDNLTDAVKRLALYRSRRLKVYVAKVSDIYDEFNYGILSPKAIRDFLRYAYFHWKRPAPSYVLLVGSVPAYRFNSFKFGFASTDNLLVCVNGDDSLPDMFIGRIPAKTPQEVEKVTEKIIRQEKEMNPGDWRRRLVFVAAPGWFESSSERLISDFIPSCYEIKRIYTDEKSPFHGTSSDLIGAINEGCALVHFKGHGGGRIWSDEKVLTMEHVPKLHNATALPFVVSFTCFTAMSGGLGEKLLMHPNGGAIGVLGSTGLGWVKGDYLLEQGLFRAVFEHGFRKLGPVVVAAKFLMPNYMLIYDILNLYNLLGDPFSDVPLPEGQIELQIIPNGESIEVIGRTTPPIDGAGELMIAGENGPLRDIRVSSENGTFRSDLRGLPDGVDLSITAYLRNESEDAIGATHFRMPGEDEVDLSISPDSVRLVEDQGEMFLSIKVDNLGGRSSGKFEVRVYVGDKVLTTLIPAVKAHRSVTTLVKLPRISGETKIVVVVDPQDEIKEANEGNNMVEKRLTPFSSNVTPSAGGKVRSPDGRVTCEFPPGSVIEPTTVSISVKLTGLLNSPQPSIHPLTEAYEISSDPPLAKAKFKISFNVKAEGEIGVYRWEESPGMWIRALEGAEGEVEKFGIYALCRSEDKVPPKISLSVIDRQLEIDGTYCSENPTISALIMDENGIQRADIYLDGNPIQDENYVFSRMEKRPWEATLTWEPDLREGKHRVKVIAYDTSLNSSEAAIDLNVGGELRIKAIANHPNPFSHETWIAYLLTRDGDRAEIKIYTTSGRLIRRLRYLPAKAGYNEVKWDGRDEEGNPASNGVYFYRVVVLSGGRRTSKTGKMIVWRGR
ncbi:hypothetical protein J7M22_04565 [Candidatus Poribacteria bacterium]|nr:hypothetical protein [Candidatus Poribacteria bacterium]